jgi:electron transport complex protein RnfG
MAPGTRKTQAARDMDSDKQTPQLPIQEDTTTGTVMILTMGVIGITCAILTVLAYRSTFATIEKNKVRFLEKAIFEVLPNTTGKLTYTAEQGTMHQLQTGERAEIEYYAGYNDRQQLTGIAIPAAGPGFQDIVRILYGYAPECRCIVGMKVLESRETPGLGTKIETDPVFLKNFEALDVRLTADKNAIANPIVLVKPRQKENPWEIDAISGATISSQAIADILQASTADTVPLIEKNLDAITR